MKKLKPLYDLLKHWNIDYYRTIHSIKTAIACLIGLACSRILQVHLQWQMGQWIPITIMVVMSAQMHFGAALQKAYMRFLGTISGVAIALLTIGVFGDNPTTIIISCIIFSACAIFTYIASSGDAISYVGTLGGVTTILTLWNQEVTIHYAIQRGIYIILGIIIAILVSRFIFPIHARDVLRSNVAKSLRGLGELYNKTIQVALVDEYTADPTLDHMLTENIAAQPELIQEACIGSRLFAQNRSAWNDILNIEHRLHRLINLLYKSLYEIQDISITQKQLNDLNSINTMITGILAELALCFKFTQPLQHQSNIKSAIDRTNQTVSSLSTQDTANKIIGEHSLLFFIEQILKELETLQQITETINPLCAPHI